MLFTFKKITQEPGKASLPEKSNSPVVLSTSWWAEVTIEPWLWSLSCYPQPQVRESEGPEGSDALMEEAHLPWLPWWMIYTCQWQVALRQILLPWELAPGLGSTHTQHKSCQLMGVRVSLDFSALHILSLFQIETWQLAKAKIECQVQHWSYVEILNRWASVVIGPATMISHPRWQLVLCWH